MRPPFLRTLSTILLTLGAAAGQPIPQEEPVTFSCADRGLVLPSFHVTHGKNYVTGLKPADVVLLEDGKPREFTISTVLRRWGACSCRSGTRACPAQCCGRKAPTSGFRFTGAPVKPCTA